MDRAEKNPEKPAVLVIAGHDPTGGAGIQADIEALASQGCRAATVVTALTVQDTRGVQRFQPVDPEFATAQAQAILVDMPIAAIKIGMLGTASMVHAVQALLKQHPDLPIVLDPVLHGGGGGALSDSTVSTAIRSQLLPLTTLATPNSPEARRLAPEGTTPEECATRLLRTGCRSVLVTGTPETGDDVVHTLYETNGDTTRFRCPRLPGEYHGSGCTLSAAIAGRIALGEPLTKAVDRAQRYTWNTLQHAVRAGRGQLLPHRFYWQPAVNNERKE